MRDDGPAVLPNAIGERPDAQRGQPARRRPAAGGRAGARARRHAPRANRHGVEARHGDRPRLAAGRATVFAAGAVGAGAAQPEGRRGGRARAAGRGGGGHRARVLRRGAAAGDPRRRARSPGCASIASSTSRPRRRWPTACTTATASCARWCSTSAAAPSTSRCWRSSKASSRSSRRRAIRAWAARTSSRRWRARSRRASALQPASTPAALVSWARLREACEQAKRALTGGRRGARGAARSRSSTGARRTSTSASRARRRRQLWAPLLDRLRAPTLRALRDANLRPEQIGEVLLVGGATRMPCVVRFAAQMFDRMPERRLPPDEAVALGAAVQAALKQGHAAVEDVVVTDVAPFTLGVAVADSSGAQLVQGHVRAHHRTRHRHPRQPRRRRFSTIERQPDARS